MVSRNPQKSPLFASHREGVAAVDTVVSLASVPVEEGMNFNGYEYAHFSVIPTGGANPNVAVAAWNGLQWCVLTESEAAQTGQGANVPFQFTMKTAGRVLFVYVTTIAAGAVAVRGSGWDANGGAG
jgi:hypothetical protein